MQGVDAFELQFSPSQKGSDNDDDDDGTHTVTTALPCELSVVLDTNYQNLSKSVNNLGLKRQSRKEFLPKCNRRKFGLRNSGQVLKGESAVTTSSEWEKRLARRNHKDCEDQQQTAHGNNNRMSGSLSKSMSYLDDSSSFHEIAQEQKQKKNVTRVNDRQKGNLLSSKSMSERNLSAPRNGCKKAPQQKTGGRDLISHRDDKKFESPLGLKIAEQTAGDWAMNGSLSKSMSNLEESNSRRKTSNRTNKSNAIYNETSNFDAPTPLRQKKAKGRRKNNNNYGKEDPLSLSMSNLEMAATAKSTKTASASQRRKSKPGIDLSESTLQRDLKAERRKTYANLMDGPLSMSTSCLNLSTTSSSKRQRNLLRETSDSKLLDLGAKRKVGGETSPRNCAEQMILQRNRLDKSESDLSFAASPNQQHRRRSGLREQIQVEMNTSFSEMSFDESSSANDDKTCGVADKVGPKSLSDNVNLDPIERIVLIDLWKDDPEDVGRAFTELGLLCSSARGEAKEENIAALCAIGGTSTIIGAMNKWCRNPKLQLEGCRVLHHATSTSSAGDTSTGNADNNFSVLAVQCRALETIVLAMNNFEHEESLLDIAFQVLYNLTATTKSIKTSARLVSGDLDGVATIVRVMETFPKSARIQNHGCMVLCSLARWKELRKPMIDARVIPVILAAAANLKNNSADQHHQSGELQKHARWALQLITATGNNDSVPT